MRATDRWFCGLAAVAIALTHAAGPRAERFQDGPELLDLATDGADLHVAGGEQWERLGSRWILDPRGEAVAAGDLNGDGVNDLILGSPGRAWVRVLFGPIEPSSIDFATREPDFAIRGRLSPDLFGAAIQVADVNLDGHQDLLIGSPEGWDIWLPRRTAGWLSVLLGPFEAGPTRSLWTEPEDYQFLGAEAAGPRWAVPRIWGDQAGTAFAVGDFNADGRPDVAVAAPRSRGPGDTRRLAGEVHVFFSPWAPGRTDLADETADLIVYGGDGWCLGTSVLAADVDGDGRDDLLLGAPEAPTPAGARGAGRLAVFHGPLASGTRVDLAVTEADSVVHGAVSGGGPGLGQVVRLGDFTGDGEPDLLFGSDAPAGAVRGLPGPIPRGSEIDLETHAGVVLVTGRYSLDHLGEWEVGLADFDGDGVDDLLLGSHWADAPADRRNAGSASVILGPLSPGEHVDLATREADLRILGQDGQFETCIRSLSFGDQLGYVLGTGDVTGDGISEIFVGAAASCGPGNERFQAGELWGLLSCVGCRAFRERIERTPTKSPGLRRSLLAKLDAACAAHDRGNDRAASNILCALLNELASQAGRGLSREDAEQLAKQTAALRRQWGALDECR